MPAVDIGEYLTIDPEIMHGRLTFKGTRVPVDIVLEYIEDGLSVEDVENEWPGVSREAAQEAVRLATESLHLRFAAEIDAADDEARCRWDTAFGTNMVQEKGEARAQAAAQFEVTDSRIDDADDWTDDDLRGFAASSLRALDEALQRDGDTGIASLGHRDIPDT